MLRCTILDGVSSYGGSRVRGTQQGGLQPAGRLKLHPLVMVAGSSKGRLTTKLGKMSAAQDVEH
jgi:hypothetical protein